MRHDDAVLGEGPDDSPWRPDADATFVHQPRRPFPDHEPSRRSAPADPSRWSASRHASPPEATTPDSTSGQPVWSTTTHRPTGEPRRRSDPVGGSRRTTWGGALGAIGFVAAAAVGFVAIATFVTSGRSTPAVGDLDAAAVAADARSARAPAVDLGGDVTLGNGDVPLLTAAACPAERLPASVEPLWTTELANSRRVVSPVTVTQGSVIAVVGFDEETEIGLPTVSVMAIGLDDGRERWRAPLQPAMGGHEIIGVVDGTVIVRSAAGPDMAYRKLFGFDEVSGELRWDRGFRGDWSASVEETTGQVYVGVRRPAVSSTDESEVEVLDPRTGDRLHIAAGAYVGIDPAGRLITRIGDKLLASSVKDRDLIGVVDPADSPFTVIGSQVAVANGDGPELSLSSDSGNPRTLPLVGSTGIDAPGFIVYLDSIGGSSLLVNGGGAVHGAQVGDDTVEIRWRVSGVVLESAPTDRGRSLLVADEGGADQRVIDSSTGRTIVDLELRPGTFATLGLVANGVVVQDYVDGELARVALDLDGRELWSLPGSGPFAIGSGVVVDVDDADGLVRLTAWGDPIDAQTATTGCRSVMTEWIPR